MNKRRLPPLNPLRNFEAAARCGSFTQAAAELNVTPVAVSRQVIVLENYFSKSLFVRHANIIELTADGVALLPSVSAALDMLNDGARLLSAKGDTAVNLCTYSGFIMQWLIPRMGHFRSEHPEINLNLITASKPDEFEAARADITIKYGHEQPHGECRKAILPDIIVPVCSPSLTRGPHALPPVENLAQHTLLRSRYRRLDWPSWLEIMNARGLHAHQELTFKESGLANQAATQGLGVAMAQRLLVENELASGKLVMPFSTALRRSADIWISRSRERCADDHVTLVYDWIEREARDTIAGFGIDFTPSTFDTAQALTLGSGR
jgi:LysR family glycine cleavage system transcriptional activator